MTLTVLDFINIKSQMIDNTIMILLNFDEKFIKSNYNLNNQYN